MTRLAPKLPKSGNGLEAISDQLVETPEQVHVVVALVDCSQITVNTDDETSEPTARILSIEPITDQGSEGIARRLLREAYARRTGTTTLPFDEETGEVTDDTDGAA